MLSLVITDSLSVNDQEGIPLMSDDDPRTEFEQAGEEEQLSLVQEFT